MTFPSDSHRFDDVGLTALIVAAARAVETSREDRLFTDPWAAAFVNAARVPVPLPTSFRDVPDGDFDPVWGRGGQYFALRTRAFDDLLLQANRVRGIRQIVLLGAGLDTRALRLDWEPGTVVYEVDRPAVLEFKHDVLEQLGAGPSSATVRRIPADLAGNWAYPLATAGLDVLAPTAWVLEGVLPYLTADTERHVLAMVDLMSEGGSTLAYEILDQQHTVAVRADHLYDTTPERMGVHLGSLFNTDPRPDSAAWLTVRGWDVLAEPVSAFTARYGRGPDPYVEDVLTRARWVHGSTTRRSS